MTNKEIPPHYCSLPRYELKTMGLTAVVDKSLLDVQSQDVRQPRSVITIWHKQHSQITQTYPHNNVWYKANTEQKHANNFLEQIYHQFLYVS